MKGLIVSGHEIVPAWEALAMTAAGADHHRLNRLAPSVFPSLPQVPAL